MPVTVSDFAATLSLTYGSSMASLILHESPTLALIPVNTATDKQDTLNWQVDFGSTYTVSADAGGDMPTSGTGSPGKGLVARASLGFSRSQSAMHIDGFARAVAQLNDRGAPRGAPTTQNLPMEFDTINSPLVASEIRRLAVNYAAYYATALFAGTTASGASGRIVGLDELVAQTTYAGINPATTGQGAWKVSKSAADTAVADLDEDAVLDEIRRYRQQTNQMPMFAVCSPANYTLLLARAANAIEQRNMPVGEIVGSGRSIRSQLTASVGLNALFIQGVPIVSDRFCSNDYIHFFGRDNYEWHSMRPADALGLQNAEIRQAAAALAQVRAIQNGAVESRDLVEYVQRIAQVGNDRTIRPSLAVKASLGDYEKIQATSYDLFQVHHPGRHGIMVIDNTP